VGPADKTGKSLTRYWPGGSRPSVAWSRARPRKPRETNVILEAPSTHSLSSRRKLDSDHPQLLFQFPEHLDEYVLRCDVKLAESIHPVTIVFSGFSKVMGDGAYHLPGSDGSRRHWHPAAARGDRGCLAVWVTSDGNDTLGYGVSQIPPGVDELVELLVQWAKELTYHSPMQLFADKRQVNQLHKRLLQHGRDFFAHLAAQWRQMRDAE